MAYAAHYTTKLEPGKKYHVYNRAVGKEKLFLTPEHNRFFLSKVEKYICPVAEIYAYALNGNHFHLSIGIADKTTTAIASQAFKKLFQSYAMAFNKQQGRYGTLFQEPYKRALVDNDEYLRNLIRYVHRNPQHHKLVPDFRLWPHTSYQQIISNIPTILNRDFVLTLFGGVAGFINLHKETSNQLHAVQTLEDL